MKSHSCPLQIVVFHSWILKLGKLCPKYFMLAVYYYTTMLNIFFISHPQETAEVTCKQPSCTVPKLVFPSAMSLWCCYVDMRHTFGVSPWFIFSTVSRSYRTRFLPDQHYQAKLLSFQDSRTGFTQMLWGSWESKSGLKLRVKRQKISVFIYSLIYFYMFDHRK